MIYTNAEFLLQTMLFDLKSSLTLSPFCLYSKPKSTSVKVDTLLPTLKTGPFTAIRPGTTKTPIHQATIDRWEGHLSLNRNLIRSYCVLLLFKSFYDKMQLLIWTISDQKRKHIIPSSSPSFSVPVFVCYNNVQCFCFFLQLLTFALPILSLVHISCYLFSQFLFLKDTKMQFLFPLWLKPYESHHKKYRSSLQ